MKQNKNSLISPVVCAVGSNYIICLPTPVEMLVSILVDGLEFFCDDNGVRISNSHVQKIAVPGKILDKAGSYTVRYNLVKKRKPYNTELYKTNEIRFSFFPVRFAEHLNVAHISDVHGLKEPAIKTGMYFGNRLDLLILNGDISSSSDSVGEVLLPLEIAYEITKGEKPCIITRGNHDLRGSMAEKLGTFYPTDNGKTYYTVDFQGISFIVLDCGEDKNDETDEYGNTVVFHPFRIKETDFLQSLSQTNNPQFHNNKKIVLSHIPFMYRDKNKIFVIEKDIYTLWCDIMRNRIRPLFGLFGHIHQTAVFPAGDPYDAYHFGSPIVLGGRPVNDPIHPDVEGAFISLSEKSAKIVFSNSSHQILAKRILTFSDNPEGIRS